MAAADLVFIYFAVDNCMTEAQFYKSITPYYKDWVNDSSPTETLTSLPKKSP